jgi:hypothetical protein
MINQLLVELESLTPREEFLCSLELVSKKPDKEIKKLGFERYLRSYMILEGYRDHDPDEISLQKLIDKLRTYDLIKGRGVLDIGISPENSKCDKLVFIRVENGGFYIVNEHTTTFEPSEYCLPVYNVKEISELPCFTQCKQLNELYKRLNRK